MEANTWIIVGKAVAAGICMGIGALGPSLGQGLIAGKACESIAKNPEVAGSIFNNMILGMAFAETSSIYCLIVSLIILFVL